MNPQPLVRCIEFVATTTDWLEGGLDDDQRAAYEQHLSACPDCTRYTHHLRVALATLRTTGSAEAAEDAVPASMRSALIDAFRARRGAGGER